MVFKKINIINFRNFENICIQLENKNVLFGLNDVGKTNFLYALRFIFDKEIRKKGFFDTDYYKGNTNLPIEIIVVLDIHDFDDDSQKLISKIKGEISSCVNEIYIKIKADFDQKEMLGNPLFYWGGNLNELQPIKQNGLFYDIDNVFNVIYIDAYVNLYSLFKKNSNKLLSLQDDEEENDDEIVYKSIAHKLIDLNNDISNLSRIKKFENQITNRYVMYHEESINISVKSEIAIKGIYNDLIPYISSNVDNNNKLYPTSGEGRKKLLVYSIYDILSEKSNEKKINIFLIEEPENHLHRSLQNSLSKILFNDSSYKYLFLSTHSSYILSEMNRVNLIRIFNDNKIITSSYLYLVPKIFEKNRKKLNKGLSECIFYNKVLLVEGQSEEILFTKVLSCIDENYEARGIFILTVDGIGFKYYVDLLVALKINNFIKTDNDLRKSKGQFKPIGLSRINLYINESDKVPVQNVNENTIETKRRIYDENKEKLNEIRKKYRIYLSRCSLEEDLDEVIHDSLVKYLGDNPIEILKEAKKYRMVYLVNKLTDEDCKKVFNSYNFACLSDIIKC